MFIVHALILTFMTTPLVLFFYPENVRKHEGEALRGRRGSDPEERRSHHPVLEDGFKSRVSVVLDKIDQLPAAMILSQLINIDKLVAPSLSPSSDEKSYAQDSSDSVEGHAHSSSLPINIDALRLIELTNRTSAVLRSQEADSLIHNDPVVSIFRTFGALNKLPISASLSVVNYDEFPDVIARHASESGSQLVILPWSRGSASVYESDVQASARNPFDGVFHKSNLQIQDQTSSVVYSEFIRGVFLKSPSDVALFVDRGMSNEMGRVQHHIFLPFFGGPDDRLALSFLVQLCHNPLVTATVVRISKVDDLSPISTIAEVKAALTATTPNHVSAMYSSLSGGESKLSSQMTVAAADTVYGNQTTQTRLASSTADGLIWDKYTKPPSETPSPALTVALSRISFSMEASTAPLRTVIDLAQASLTQNVGKTLIVFLGRSRRMAVESHQAELRQIMIEAGGHMGSSVPKTLGDVGAALVAKGVHTSLLVMQAAVAGSS